MAFISTETVANETIESLNAMISSDSYFDLDSIQIRKLFANVNKLMPIDPAGANVIKAGIYQLCGDLENVEYHVGLANKLPTDSKKVITLNSVTALSNIGAFSKSQEHFRKIEAQDSIELFRLFESGVGSLSMIKLDSIFEKAKKMDLNYKDEKIQITSRAASILRANNISDEDVAKYADVFGELIRENRLMLKGSHPVITVGDSLNNWYPSTVFITFKISGSFQKAAGLYKEGTKRILEKFKSIPESIHFSIESA